ncbi:MAG: 50S ribosomal protein L10 [Ignavibacteria bacterium]|nr:50S ribosomal protein L10 [Ignavibacteria bacterium]
MEREKKVEIIEEIKKLMSESNALYFIDFTYLTVAETNELRNEFYNSDVKYKVVKNTLALRALKESDKYSPYVDKLSEFLVGPTGIVFAGKDPVIPAKILKKNFDKIGKPKFKVAILEGNIYSSDKLEELSSLLSRDEVISSICGSLGSPVAGIVGAINAVIRDLASVIEEVAKKKAA